MATYKLKSRAYWYGVTKEAGEIVEFDGEPGDNLEPMDGEAKAAKKAATARRASAGADGGAAAPSADESKELKALRKENAKLADESAKNAEALADALKKQAELEAELAAAQAKIADIDKGVAGGGKQTK